MTTMTTMPLEPGEILARLGVPVWMHVGRSDRIRLGNEWRSWSLGVRAYYVTTANAYFDYCARAGHSAKTPTTESLLAFVKASDIAPSTAVQFVARIRRLFALFGRPIESNAILTRIAKDWKRHATQEQHYEPIGWRAFEPGLPTVSDILPDPVTAKDHLDRALFLLQSDCAARPHEPRLSRIGGIDVQRRVVRLKLVEQKGKPTGEAVELSEQTYAAFVAYRQAIGRPLPADPQDAADCAIRDELLFLGMDRHDGVVGLASEAFKPLSRRYLERALRRRLVTYAIARLGMTTQEATGFSERYSGKSFRIGGAAALFEDNGTAEEIANQGRWARPQQSNTYLSGLLLSVNPAARAVWAMAPPCS